MTGRPERGRRRRRTPEVAEREIVDAAEAMLRERPFRELTVDEVMRRTDLSRPSFYVYFRDRHDLVLRVVERLGGELFAMSERWYAGTGDGPALVREAIEGIVAGVRGARAGAAGAGGRGDRRPARRGRPTRACCRASSTPRRSTSRRRSPPGACCRWTRRETAKALVWMMERYLQLSLGRPPLTRPGDGGGHADDDLVARALRDALRRQLG